MGLEAATLTVTTSADQLDVPAGAQLSLREAIRDAATGDTIDFNAGLSGALVVLTKFAFVIDVKDLDIDASALPSGISIEPSSSFPSRHFNISGGTTVTLNNLTLSGGTSTARGGALHASGGADVSLFNCELKNNQSDAHGGAIYNTNSTLTVSNCIIRGNSSISGDGGGIFSDGTNSTIAIRQTLIKGNRSADRGGGICNNDGITLDLIDCTLSDNVTRNGGGIYNAEAHLRSNRSTLSYNHASEHGGGIYLDEGANLTFRNSTTAGNRALEGGGFFLAPTSTPTFTFTTMSDNTAALRGGGIFSDAALIELRNTAIAGNDARGGVDFFRDGGTVALFGNSLVGDNQSVDTEIPAGNPNANGDFAGTTASPLDASLSALGIYGGYTTCMLPLESSPLIDNAGSTSLTSDQRQLPRNVGSSPDIGAVERSPSLLITTADDEDNGALGLGAGDSLREALLYSLGDTNRLAFDPSLDGSTITLTSEIAVPGNTAFIDASELASGVTLDGGHSNRILHLSSASTVSLHNVTFLAGTADDGGGGIYSESSSLTLDRCTLIDNSVTNGVAIRRGGAIRSDLGSLTIHGCSFISNRVSAASSDTQGGAIAINQGSAEIRNSIFEDNWVIQANAASGGALHTTEAEVLVEQCTFTDNLASAISLGRGGAIYAATGELLVRRSGFVDNQGLATTGAGQGGGVFSQTGTTIEDCALWNNAVSSSSGSGSGGAVYHSSISYLNMLNSTVKGNTALTGGGGISIVNGNAALRHLTVAGGNFAEGGGGGIELFGSGNFVTFENCLIAGNFTILPIDGPDIDDDSTFTLTAAGTNLIGNNTTVTNTFPQSPLVGIAGAEVDPMLGSLGDYGGPTKTMPLLAESPAIDAAVITSDTPLLDQRQFARIRGGAPDIGAYETDNDAGYVAWTMEQIPSGSDTNFIADLEPDTIVNGWEYGQRLNPTNADTFTFTPTYSAPSNVLLSFPFRAQAPDLIYTVESTDSLFEPFSDSFSIDLSTYATTVSVPNVTFDIDPIDETITYSEAITGSNTSRFWRLVLQLIQ
jgi:hypothetical protein